MQEKISDKVNKKKSGQRALWLLLFAAIILIGFSAYFTYEKTKSAAKTETIAIFHKDLKDGKIKNLTVIPSYLFQKFDVELKDGSKYHFQGPHIDSKAADEIIEKGVTLEWHKPATDFSALPHYILIGIMVLMLASTFAQTAGLSIMKPVRKSSVKMKDVAGNEEAKDSMQEVIEYLRNPAMYEKLGAKFPKGIIMDGPPGTGKTLLAKAVAGEADANFMAVSGSDFSSMFVGMTGMKIRGMFRKARRSAPCVLFIDEIDAIGGKRLNEGTAVAREMGSALNSLLVMMDGFDDNTGVIVIAATNRIELLDPALLRSGRFDRHIHMQLPNQLEREEILGIHAKNIQSNDLDLSAVSKECAGMSGADLANVINQAALIAVKENASAVSTLHAMRGRDRVLMGDARYNQAASMNAKTKKILAIHEAGHAIVGMVYGPDPVSRISILPRGQSLGQTMLIPSEDNFIIDSDNILSRIRLLLGGRAAEFLIAKTQTTGASDDLRRATKLALDYVMSYGMGQKTLLYIDEHSSNDLRRQAEEEANSLLESCMTDACNAISTNRMLYDDLVSCLIKSEEIHGEEVMSYARRVRDNTQMAKDLAAKSAAAAPVTDELSELSTETAGAATTSVEA